MSIWTCPKSDHLLRGEVLVRKEGGVLKSLDSHLTDTGGLLGFISQDIGVEGRTYPDGAFRLFFSALVFTRLIFQFRYGALLAPQ